VNNKPTLRQTYQSKRLKLQSEEVNIYTAKIITNLKKIPQVMAASRLLVFYPIQNEPNLIEYYQQLLIAKKHLIFPKTTQKGLIPYKIDKLSDLQPSPPYNIPEPSHHKAKKIDIEKIDLVFVPGLVFDKRGHRIGFGKGHYDHFLAQISAPKIGICFDFQIIDNIPEEAHDEIVDIIVTPSKIITI